MQELHTLAGDIELYGVPGPVRTANLPLRRGMLYPIELLGLMTGAGPDGVATDGVHVNGQGGFCHVVRQLFRRKPLSHPTGDKRLPTGLPSPSCKMH